MAITFLISKIILGDQIARTPASTVTASRKGRVRRKIIRSTVLSPAGFANR
jgi:hypothetical protein